MLYRHKRIAGGLKSRGIVLTKAALVFKDGHGVGRENEIH